MVASYRKRTLAKGDGACREGTRLLCARQSGKTLMPCHLSRDPGNMREKAGETSARGASEQQEGDQVRAEMGAAWPAQDW